MFRYVILGLLLVPLVAAGCSAPVRSGTYTVASTKHGADVLGSEFVLVKKSATGSASTPIILVPFGFPRDYEVMEKILEEHGGDILTNVKMTSSSTLFLFFGAYKLDVTCDVWKVAGSADAGGKSGERTFAISEIGDVDFVRNQGTQTADRGVSK